ncbi:hypothetical protein [Roseovarius ramblicola]|uniref:Uncharacterized protein n=1 Tax=Roseovarius ramblicola TaxID=2022336 RepID=A0ABV5I4C1_9RHOB
MDVEILRQFDQRRLAMVFSSLAASCRRCTENPPVPDVQMSGTSSVVVALMYFALCYPLSLWSYHLERRMNVADTH